LGAWRLLSDVVEGAPWYRRLRARAGDPRGYQTSAFAEVDSPSVVFDDAAMDELLDGFLAASGL
jgi:hypothetical protein